MAKMDSKTFSKPFAFKEQQLKKEHFTSYTEL
jgi:hypothetical protein